MSSETKSTPATPSLTRESGVSVFAPAHPGLGTRRVLPYAVPARRLPRPNRGNWRGTIGVASVFALMILTAVAYAVTN